MRRKFNIQFLERGLYYYYGGRFMKAKKRSSSVDLSNAEDSSVVAKKNKKDTKSTVNAAKVNTKEGATDESNDATVQQLAQSSKKNQPIYQGLINQVQEGTTRDLVYQGTADWIHTLINSNNYVAGYLRKMRSDNPNAFYFGEGNRESIYSFNGVKLNRHVTTHKKQNLRTIHEHVFKDNTQKSASATSANIEFEVDAAIARAGLDANFSHSLSSYSETIRNTLKSYLYCEEDIICVLNGNAEPLKVTTPCITSFGGKTAREFFNELSQDQRITDLFMFYQLHGDAMVTSVCYGTKNSVKTDTAVESADQSSETAIGGGLNATIPTVGKLNLAGEHKKSATKTVGFFIDQRRKEDEQHRLKTESTPYNLSQFSQAFCGDKEYDLSDIEPLYKLFTSTIMQAKKALALLIESFGEVDKTILLSELLYTKMGVTGNRALYTENDDHRLISRTDEYRQLVKNVEHFNKTELSKLAEELLENPFLVLQDGFYQKIQNAALKINGFKLTLQNFKQAIIGGLVSSHALQVQSDDRKPSIAGVFTEKNTRKQRYSFKEGDQYMVIAEFESHPEREWITEIDLCPKFTFTKEGKSTSYKTAQKSLIGKKDPININGNIGGAYSLGVYPALMLAGTCGNDKPEEPVKARLLTAVEVSVDCKSFTKKSLAKKGWDTILNDIRELGLEKLLQDQGLDFVIFNDPDSAQVNEIVKCIHKAQSALTNKMNSLHNNHLQLTVNIQCTREKSANKASEIDNIRNFNDETKRKLPQGDTSSATRMTDHTAQLVERKTRKLHEFELTIQNLTAALDKNNAEAAKLGKMQSDLHSIEVRVELTRNAKRNVYDRDPLRVVLSINKASQFDFSELLHDVVVPSQPKQVEIDHRAALTSSTPVMATAVVSHSAPPLKSNSTSRLRFIGNIDRPAQEPKSTVEFILSISPFKTNKFNK